MCDVPSTANQCLPDILSRYFFRSIVTIFVAPVAAGITKHFMSHIHLISVLKFLYLNLLSASIRIIFLSNGIATLLLLLLFVINFMQSIYNYIPKTNHVFRV
jgi:hypothetical protein